MTPGTPWRAVLLPLAIGGYLTGAWLSSLVLLDTPLFDVTVPKLVLLGGGFVFLVAQPWRNDAWHAFDRRPILLLAAAAAWLIIVTALRGDVGDLKQVAGALLFGGLAFVITLAGCSAGLARASRLVTVAVVFFGVASFVGAALEVGSYQVGGADPLADVWRIFRVQVAPVDPSTAPSPLHFYAGDLVLRVAGFSWHPNSLGLSMLVPAAFACALIVEALRASAWRSALFGIGLLIAVTMAIAWTASRVSLVGLVGIVVATAVFAAFGRARGATTASQSHRIRSATALLIVGTLVLGVVVAVQATALARLAGTFASADGATGTVPTTFEIAADGTQVRWAMLRVGVAVLTASPLAVVIGPGLYEYGRAARDPTSPSYIPEMVGFTDPNSYWLTIGLMGGVVAVGLLIVAFVLVWLGLLRSRLEQESNVAHAIDWTRITVLWLLTWIPVWSIVQNLGSMPFSTAVATPVGFVLGLGVAFAARSDTMLEATSTTGGPGPEPSRRVA